MFRVISLYRFGETNQAVGTASGAEWIYLIRPSQGGKDIILNICLRTGIPIYLQEDFHLTKNPFPFPGLSKTRQEGEC